MLRRVVLGPCLCLGLVLAPREAPGQPVANPDAPAANEANEAQPAGSGEARPVPGRVLGAYEREALATALEQRGLQIDPEPSGKRVGRIVVVNLPVFGKRNGFLQWFNVFHRTTRPRIIEREVLLRPGQLWDDEIVEETQRELNDALFTALVVVAPVRSAQPGRVDLLVVTRDIWSLRLNSNYEIQERTLAELTLSISENNLFGLRKQAALVFDMNLGTFSLGPLYVDKNIAGTRLQLQTRWRALFARDTGEFEGTQSGTVLAYPLWSLRREWGMAMTASHFDGKVRVFSGTELFAYDNPDTAEVEAVPYSYRYRVFTLDTVLTRSLPGRLIHRFNVGHELRVTRPSLLDEFPDDPVLREAFARDVFPRSERSSAMVLAYRWFTPEFVTYRDVDSYDLPEDRKLGPDVRTEIAVARRFIGSERDFVRFSTAAAWQSDWRGDGFVALAGSVAGRRESGASIDNTFSGAVSVAAPRIGNVARVVAGAVISLRTNDANNSFFTLGGASGLRTYPIGAFRGQALVRTNLEIRTLPRTFWFTRYGGLLFWDMGHAAEEFGDLSMHHGVGIGLRLLIPQMQPFVFRFDWGVALSGPTAGFPGRFTAGARQVF